MLICSNFLGILGAGLIGYDGPVGSGCWACVRQLGRQLLSL